MTIKRVCVFCASSPKVDQYYLDQATQLGKILAKKDIAMNYGGGEIGLMGAAANAMLSNKGSVRGVIPQFMVEVEWAHKGVEDMVITQTMAERKQLLVEGVDAIIVLPGSTGTLEELAEVLSNKKLGLFNKPIVIVNAKGFYTPLIKMLELMIEENFMTGENARLWIEVPSVENIVEVISQELRDSKTTNNSIL
ncbi:TIGR00730 family Rossman fold protein [Saccharicrinis aurantiacus]|uniref:LOG family protein n=1 Tax=Saccharicrinis aurantiacus TaxID=1849719 RepID=UPI00248FD574|nr:TIGR00730 family Rossman fold protein [Saccharicrinis aurantiacus]